MNKIITKTSIQAQLDSKIDCESRCPECNKQGFGSYMTQSVGFLKTKLQRKNDYSCFFCKCEWTTGWKDV